MNPSSERLMSKTTLVMRNSSHADCADSQPPLLQFQRRSRRREVGAEDDTGVEPLHVVELHPDGPPVAEHVDVALAPDERVDVDLVLVDQAPLRERVCELAAPVHEQVAVDLVLQLRDGLPEVPPE